MELINLEGNIIGVITDNYIDNNYNDKRVKDIVLKKANDALKMVNLDESFLEKTFNELSIKDKNKVILASKLQESVIILKDFSKGMNKKDIEFFKNIFKKIINYNRKIILIDNNPEIFLNCVDKIYVINKNEIFYATNNIFDLELEKYMDVPKIVEFINTCEKNGIKLNHYQEIDELLKAIYRIKS